MWDFDNGVDRRGTNCVKWDLVPEGVIPMGIADMDFATAPAVLEAARKRLDGHPVFGYGWDDAGFFDNIVQWYERTYGVTPERDWLVRFAGVVPGLAALANVAEGDVLASTPNYHLLLAAPERAGKRCIRVPLRETLAADGAHLSYDTDFDALDKAASKDVGILYLCNPQNPVGKVYTREELRQIADLADSRGLVVVSDEIHSEIILGDTPHTPYWTVAPERSITILSPGKICNMPGISVAFAVVPDGGLREKAAGCASALGGLSALQLAAGAGAFSQENDAWKHDLRAYLRANRDYLELEILRLFPRIRLTTTEGSYLQWLDFSACGLDDIAELFLETARVQLSGGAIFGASGRQARLNFGCPRKTLEEALRRIGAVSG